MRNEIASIESAELEYVVGGNQAEGSVGKTGVTAKVNIPNDKNRNKCNELNKHRSTDDVERLCGSNAKDREDNGDLWKSVRGVFGLK